MVCGAATVDMGIWSSWSLLRFMVNADFVIHSDGTLSEVHIARWKRVIPWMKVVTQDASALSEGFSIRYPRLSKWRRQHACNAQVIDYHLATSLDAVIGIDSDVLFFRDPIELRSIGRTVDTEMWTMRDLGYAYAAPLHVIEAGVGVPVPPLVNGGCYSARRISAADLELLERVLDTWTDEMKAAYWAAQTLLAVVAARRKSRMLPVSYDIYVGSTRPDSVARHYVNAPHTPIRSRFFTEGVARLVREIGLNR